MVTSKITKTTTTELGVDIKVKDILAMVEPTIQKLFGVGHPHIEVSIVWDSEQLDNPETDDVIIHVRAILVVNE